MSSKKISLNDLTFPEEFHRCSSPIRTNSIKGVNGISPKGVVLRKSNKTPEQIEAEIKEAMGI